MTGISVGNPKLGTMNRAAIAAAANTYGRVDLPAGDLYIDGTVTCPEHPFTINAPYPTRIFQMGNGPLFRLPGTDGRFEGQLTIFGNKADPIFEIEGNSRIATGRHIFRDLLLYQVERAGAFKAIDGYWRDGKFTKDENHADNCLIDRCHIFGKEPVTFRSINQQALGWNCRDGSINCISDTDSGDAIGAWIERGGWFRFHNMTLNHQRFTWFKVKDHSPNQCRLVTTDFLRDYPQSANHYMTVLDYRDVDPAVVKYAEWHVTATGFLTRHMTDYDASKHFVGNGRIPIAQGWPSTEIRISGTPA